MLPWLSLLPKARCTTLVHSLSCSLGLAAGVGHHDTSFGKSIAHESTPSACNPLFNQQQTMVAARTFATGSVQERIKRQLDGLALQLPNSPFDKRRLGPPVPKLVLYRGRWMLLFRFLVRAKVFQLLGIFAGAAFLAGVFNTTNLPASDVAALGAVLVGCVVTSYCIWFMSGRYVGELSLLLPERRIARFSVLDFWGNRHDTDVPVSAIVPPFKGRSTAEVKRLASATLIPLDVIGDRQYLFSVRHGHILQKQVLQDIFYGVYTPEPGNLPGNLQGGTSSQETSNTDSSSAMSSSSTSSQQRSVGTQTGKEQGTQTASTARGRQGTCR